MNKTEFLEQLERLLYDIPEQEREEALDFYRSYFEDAGEDQESNVIQELGNPGKVAAIIKADLEENREEHGEYTESGYQDERFREEHVPEKTESSSYRSAEEKKASSGETGNQGPYSRYRGYTGAEHRHQRRGLSWPLLIVFGIIALCALPFVFGVGGSVLISVLMLLVGLVIGILGLFVGLLFGGIGCLIGGFAGVVHTVLHLLSHPATALAVTGGSLILIAIGLVSCLAFAWLAFKLVPAVFRWSVDFIQRLMHRGNHGGGSV